MSRSKQDPIDELKFVIARAEFGRHVSGRLAGLRHVQERDRETLDRIIAQAMKTLCSYCMGRTGERFCSKCHGTGEVAYDPNLPVVEDVMGS